MQWELWVSADHLWSSAILVEDLYGVNCVHQAYHHLIWGFASLRLTSSASSNDLRSLLAGRRSGFRSAKGPRSQSCDTMDLTLNGFPLEIASLQWLALSSITCHIPSEQGVMASQDLTISCSAFSCLSVLALRTSHSSLSVCSCQYTATLQVVRAQGHHIQSKNGLSDVSPALGWMLSDCQARQLGQQGSCASVARTCTHARGSLVPHL